MRYQPLPASFHTANRATLAGSIGPDAIAIIDTADLITRAGDFEYPFRPDSNFYYLTGIDQPEAVLVLIPGHPNPAAREMLFLKPGSAFASQWVGEGHSPESATKLSGVKSVHWLPDLEPMLDRLLPKFSTLYSNAEGSLTSHMTSPAKRRMAAYKSKLPLHQCKSLLPFLSDQRTIKHPAEVDQIRRAIAATHEGLKSAWKNLKPGVPEYVLEADLTGEFIRRGATHAFSPIIAAGINATVIHYMANDATIGPSDLVLFDVGAEVGYYASDISRVVPVSGRLTPRQRAVYEAVYEAQQSAVPLHKPGASIYSIDDHMRKSLTAALPKLGLKGPLEQYYPHSSHHLGLDVHDTGSPRAKLAPGMVVTCEPGFYIKEEGIGVRLEDDILITKSEPEVLSAAIPSSPDDIEAFMKGIK